MTQTHKTITPRTKAFKNAADRTGWHVTTPTQLLPYNYDDTMTQIVDTMSAQGMRLVNILGNVLEFVPVED